MSGQLLLVNPRRRRRKAAPARASRRIKRAAPRRRRRRNPIGAYVSAANPIRRTYKRRRRSNPLSLSRRRHRRYGRNPISGVNSRSIMNLIKEGAIGAGGALMVDVISGYLPLPASMKTPSDGAGGINYMYYAGKTGLALLLGTFGRKLLGNKAQSMAVGSMTITAYTLFRQMLPSGITLGYQGPGRMAGLNRFVSGNGMGAYVSGGSNRMAHPQVGMQNPMSGRSGSIKNERAMYVK